MIGDEKMFVCIECGHIFENPKRWEETHGLDCGPYEQFSGCTICGGAYTEAYKCDCCNEWITTEEYAKTKNGDLYCEECFTLVKLGDE